MTYPNPYLIPAALVIGFALVAGAIVLSNSTSAPTTAHTNDGMTAEQPAAATNDGMTAEQPAVATTDAIAPVTDADHIKGDVAAPIKIVEFSDFECPFCQRFHATLNDVVAPYLETGEVAWVYRQFPIEQLHSKAPTVALASECVASLGGDEAFWQFTDRYFAVSPSNNRTDIESVIPQLVTEIGLDQAAFTACMDDGSLMAAVEADMNDAAATGGRGTPWSIVIAPNGTTFPINGAQPAAAVEQLIEIARGETYRMERLIQLYSIMRRPAAWLLTLLVAGVIITGAVWVPNLALISTVLGSSAAWSDKVLFLATLYQSIGTNFTFVSASYTVLIALLFGMQFVLLLRYIKQTKTNRSSLRRASGAGIGGLVAGFFGIGCAACGTFILSSVLALVGAGGLVAWLPLGGEEFGFLGVGLLGYAIWVLLRKLEEPLVCLSE